MFVKSKLSDYALTIIDQNETEKSDNSNQALDEILLRTFQTFRLFCASMGLKRPEISEEKSQYQMSKNEIDSISMKKKLIETDEIDEEIVSVFFKISQLFLFQFYCSMSMWIF